MSEFGWRSVRSWIALIVMIVAWFWFPHLEDVFYYPVARAVHLHMVANGAMMLAPYAWLMVVRIGMNLVLLAVIMLLLGQRFLSFPISDTRLPRRLTLGLLTGLAVMTGAILIIVAVGAAHVKASQQTPLSALAHGVGWLVADLVGAAGEELYGRGAVLLVAAAFFGWRGALIISGLSFVALHLGNPGADPIWLTRLFCQGMLLAYAVYRTNSIWWSVGYHTGWNLASAPLFGAAGSGYLDAGHIFDFNATGSALITGGAVGPEGSIFAFVAVLVAGVVLVLTFPQAAALHARHQWRGA